MENPISGMSNGEQVAEFYMWFSKKNNLKKNLYILKKVHLNLFRVIICSVWPRNYLYQKISSAADCFIRPSYTFTVEYMVYIASSIMPSG